MKEIVLATGNAGKIVELKAMLSPLTCIPQYHFTQESIEETGLSFVENALIKARFASKMSGKAALADDSGLVVPALQGEPGIYSARYAGDNASDNDNIELLLSRMHHIPPPQRMAFFYCAIVVVLHEKDPVPLIGTGLMPGSIAEKPAGNQGFGYDPIFLVPTLHCSAAELDIAVKNSISHRSQALRAIRENLLGYLS